MSKKGDLTVHENGHTATNSVVILGKRYQYPVLASCELQDGDERGKGRGECMWVFFLFGGGGGCSEGCE